MSIGNSSSDDRFSAADDGRPSAPEDDRPPVPEEDRPSVGRVLQKARIDAGLTVEEVSSTTRVRIPIVHGIEQDDFTRCGGHVYARGHIRTLARAVGLDPAALVERYDAEHGGRPEPVLTAPLFETERIRSEPRRPNWTAAMVAAIVAVVAFVGFTLFSGEESSGKPVAGNTTTAKPSPSKKPTKPADPKPDPSESAIAAVPADKVTVKLAANKGSSWISVKDHSGRLLHEGILKEGDSQTFTDKERIDLVLGNAGAIKLYVNGKQIDDRGDKGQVQRLSYTKGDPEAG